LGRRDEDARPPIEVLGADLEISSTQQVKVGRARPDRRRRRALAAAAVIGGVLLGGLVLDDDGTGTTREERDNRERTELDKPQTSTTARRTTTTRPTTTTAPVGPPLGAPAEGALVLADGSRWTIIDLADGRRRQIDMPPDAAWQVVVVARGVVVPAGGTARYHELYPTASERPAVELGPADQAYAAEDDEQVWLVDGPEGGDDDGSGELDVRLVDLTGRVLRSFRLPGRWINGVAGDTVLLSRGGRIYATEGDGLRPVATGVLSGILPGAAVVLSCDDAARCGLRRIPLDGGRSTLLHEVADPDAAYFDWRASPEGRLAITESTGDHTADQRLLLFDQAGRSLGSLPLPTGGSGARPAWLPGDAGLVVPNGSGLAVVRLTDGDPTVEALTFRPLFPEHVYIVGP
jgi:hypothetical protein